MTMDMDYIQRRYSVPAAVGARVRYKVEHEPPIDGTIVGSCGHYLRIRYDGATETAIHHPTWCLTYLDEEGKS